ncbi:MAG: tetratricopeptide repeat protein [Chloroflexi bacterium]|nr:tetratricopeptide repeat protein [Chloroflexota bacterium]
MAAIPYYQATLALTPQDHWARLRLGYALYWGAGDLSAAVTAIQQAITAWPDEKYRQWPYFYLGEVYENAGLVPEAVAAYERALQLDPA